MSSANTKPTSQHGVIFRASFFTGGAQVAASLASMVRMKFVALVLGLAGVGVNGLLFQASSLVQTSLGFGIGSSGVRSVAAAYGAGNLEALSRTVRALRVWVWATGLLCLAVCAGFSRQLSTLTFGNQEHTTDFVVMGFAALLQQISAGQTAVLRGLRRIKELAQMNILSALTSLILALPCFWLFGIHGIAVSFLASACVALVCSWNLARREKLVTVKLTRQDIWLEGRELLNAGFAFVGTALAGGVAGYFGALVVRQALGVEGNGLYQAGMGITVVLVGFVLSAMGQDYYPKLVALLRGKNDIGSHIHDQIDMALLMGLPLLVATSSMAPWALRLVYSEEFIAATPVVIWLAVGSLWRIVSWPLGFALLAEGKNAVILSFEAGAAVLSVSFVWLGVRASGVEGAAIAFAALEIVHWLVLMLITARRFNFRMHGWLYLHILLGTAVIVAGRWTGSHVGLLLTLMTAAICGRILIIRLGPAHRLALLLAKFGPLHRGLGLPREFYP